MSVNGFVTAILALAAIVVPIVALVISNTVDKRATRSALTSLAVEVGSKAAAFEKLERKIEDARAKGDHVRAKKDDELFALMKEIEMLVGQADFLVYRIKAGFFARRIPALARRPRFSPSVAVTLAQALESVHDPWWADRYWEMGVQTDDQHVRALTFKYWGMALCGRFEYRRARRKVQDGLRAITSAAAAECIFKGEICAAMIPFDHGNVQYWHDAALEEYGSIFEDDELYSIAEDRIERVQDLMVSTAEPPAPDEGSGHQDVDAGGRPPTSCDGRPVPPLA